MKRGNRIQQKVTKVTKAVNRKAPAGRRTPNASRCSDTFGPDGNSVVIGDRLRRPGFRARLRAWLDARGHRDVGITNLKIAAQHTRLRAQVITHCHA